MPKHPPRYDGVVERGPDGLPRWTGLVNVDEWALNQPLRWRKPRRVFPCSMSDLFHEDVPDATIQRAWCVMAHCPQHTFLVLTKRADRMHDWVNHHTSNGRPYMFVERPGRLASDANGNRIPWPLQNVVLMVTAENQRWADKRIPKLLATPAAAHGISLEPLLSAIDLSPWLPLPVRGDLTYGEYDTPVPTEVALSWAIVAGESGPGARPLHPDWVRSVRDQCQEAGVPFFWKGWGAWGRRGESGVTLDDAPFGAWIDWAPGNSEWRDSTISSYSEHMVRVGKAAAGRLLDGRTWDEYPEEVDGHQIRRA